VTRSNNQKPRIVRQLKEGGRYHDCGGMCETCQVKAGWPLARDARKLQPEGDDREPEPQASCGDPGCGDKCDIFDDPWHDGSCSESGFVVPLSGAELAERYGFAKLSDVEFAWNVDRETSRR
jgi:hypothetical protein